MKFKKYIFLLVLVLGLFTAFSFSQKVLARETRTSRVTIVNPPEGEFKDHYIAYGESVEVVGDVFGDVYALGGDIKVSGNITGDLIVFGGTILIDGNISQDVRIFGGDVFIGGIIGRNLLVVSGIADISQPATINGGVVAVNGEFIQAAPILGQLNVYSGKTTLSSSVGDNVEIITGELNISDAAIIASDLTYTSDQDAYVQEGASISGSLMKNTLPEYSQEFESQIEDYRKGVNAGTKTLSFLTLLITGIVFIRLFPKLFVYTSKRMDDKWWKNLLVGFLMLILVPISAILLMITLVGLPLAFVLILTYFATLYFARIFVSYWLGSKIVKIRSKYLSFSLGLFAVTLLGMLPRIGGTVSFLILLFALGSLSLNFKEYTRKEK